jgi:uncharacterized protein with HEPN domain
MTRTGIPQLLTDLIDYATQAIDGMDAYAGADERYRRFIRGSVMRDLIVIGEIATRLGTEFHEQHQEIPWRMIIAQRNIVAHGYDAIVWERLLALREHHLPELIRQARVILDQYSPPPTES